MKLAPCLMPGMGGKRPSIQSAVQCKPVLRNAGVKLLPCETAFHCFGWMTGEPLLGVCECRKCTRVLNAPQHLPRHHCDGSIVFLKLVRDFDQLSLRLSRQTNVFLGEQLEIR